jgi:preprotein translocase subunit YajC
MLSLLIADAHAQAAPAAPQGGFSSFVPLIAIFFIFYFLMIRPQKKKMDEEQKFLSNIQKGDEVYTKSGMLGTIHGLTDKVVTLELADGIKVKFLRTQIGGASKEVLEPKQDKK